MASELPRAKRIPDAEWESQRERLLELYLEKDTSREEIIKTMAQEYNFVITYEMPSFPSLLAFTDHGK